MITNKQYQRLMSEYQKTGKVVVSAMKADVHPQTARKYIEAGKRPDELQAKHSWRTRSDPVGAIWPEAQRMLENAPELEAKELFEHLCGVLGEEAGVDATALRTFQRRVQSWRLRHGQDKEVFFAQEHFPGRVMQLDWTNANALRVTIGGRRLDHLLCHSVLTYSNWEWATRCQSESLLSLRHGLQESLHRLGAAPQRLQIDNTSAATHPVGSGGRQFNPDFLSLVRHYGMKPQTIGVDCPDQNGDVESQNGHLKRRLEQHLLLRGYRDFDSVAAYDGFVAGVLEKANQTRRARLTEEYQVMRPLPPTRLSEYDELRCRVSQHSTIRVKKAVYSVPARLIGHEVRVEVYEMALKIFHGRELLLSLPRVCGDRGVLIDYRHIIEHLLRKPGAFPHYVHREELFPDSTFRLAYDRLVADHGERGGQLEYLHLLKLAAELGEAAIGSLVGEWSGAMQPCKWTVTGLRRFLGLEQPPTVPDLHLEAELSGYDALLSQEVSHAS
jgi:transposase InsO family protein